MPYFQPPSEENSPSPSLASSDSARRNYTSSPMDTTSLRPSFSPINIACKESEESAKELPRSWDLPPKPRPGRKRSDDVPGDYRKMSNRNAQRAFRQRKKAAAELAERQVREAKGRADRERHEKEVLLRDAQIQQEQMRQQRLELERLKQEIANVTNQMRSSPYPGAVFSSPMPIHPMISHNAQHRMPESMRNYTIDPQPQPYIDTSLPRNSHAGTSRQSSSLISPFTIPQERAMSTSFSHTGQDSTSLVTTTSIEHAEHDQAQSFESESGYSGSTFSHGKARADQNLYADTSTHLSASSTDQTGAWKGNAETESLEIDFTSWRNEVKQRFDALPTQEDENERDCGFCTDQEFCPCSFPHDEEAERADSGVGQANMSAKKQGHGPPQPVEPSCQVGPPNRFAPGSCDDCMKDPARRQLCMDIAAMPVVNPPARLREDVEQEEQSTFPENEDWIVHHEAVALAIERDPDLPNQPYYQTWLNELRKSRTINSTRDEGKCASERVEVAGILRDFRKTPRD